MCNNGEEERKKPEKSNKCNNRAEGVKARAFSLKKVTKERKQAFWICLQQQRVILMKIKKLRVEEFQSIKDILISFQGL